MSDRPSYRVRAVHCDHRADEEEVYAALRRATARLDKAWEKLRCAGRITVKFNQAWRPDRLVYLDGQLQELVDPKVAGALLRLLREYHRRNPLHRDQHHGPACWRRVGGG